MRRKRVNRRRSSRKAPRIELQMPVIPWAAISRGIAMLSVGVAAWAGTTWLMDRPVNSVRLEGPFERVTVMQVEAAISPYIKEGFVTADLRQLRSAVTALPWAQDASIRRSWPSTLNIVVTEEQAAARWGEKGLLNVYGELFVEEASHIPAELPKLSGPAGSELEVARRFFAIDTQLKQRGLNAVALRVDERGSWQLTVSNGMQVRFGAVSVDARIVRFMQALDGVLAPAASDVAYVDMRYTNGFSIGWKAADGVKLADTGEADPHA